MTNIGVSDPIALAEHHGWKETMDVIEIGEQQKRIP